MPNPFKLLVMAIATVLLLMVFFAFIAPMFFPKQDPAEQISLMLLNAETLLGKGSSNTVQFNSGSAFQGISFDSPVRSVNFSCNSATICCPKGAKCPAAIEWDDRKIIFNEARAIETTARCEQQYGIFTCKIYFGEKPAQIEIISARAENEFDLSEGNPKIFATLKNSGSQEMLQGTIDAKVVQLVSQNGGEEEIPIASAAKTETIGSLNAGEQKEIGIELNLREGGKFKAIITASGLEAGFDEKSVSFTAKGAADECIANSCDAPSAATGKCIARCYCSNCLIGSRCAQKLKETGASALGLPAGTDLSAAENYILGSDIVEFVLPDSACE
ncbi:MAG: hypothetical protein Q8N60_05750 [Candidatus Diapherotrites archaeon]|nr:hypothetical protein [Candidatus Diapherotrites archaeon]